MSAIRRYLRLYAHFVAFAFGKAFEFRFDFFMRILMDLCYYAVAIAFYKTLFLHTGSLGGWSESQAMIFVSGYLIVDGINMTLFSNNMWMLPYTINKGELDYALVRPVSSLFFLGLRDFAANSFVNLLFALGILAWALYGHEPFPGWGKVALYLLMLLNGSVIFFCLNMMANTLTFWTHSPHGHGEMVWTMSRFAERPDRIYKGWIRRVLTLILPYAVISSFPARLILEEFDWRILLHMIGVSALFLALLILLWRQALRSYSSASS